MTAVVPYTESELPERMEYARTLATAGSLIPSSLRDGPNPSPGKVFLALEMGAMLHLHPLAALSGIHVIEGKPSMGVGLMAAVVRRSGHTLRIATTGTWAAGDYEAIATLIRSDDPDHTYEVRWNADRARQANLLGRGNWKTYPEAMCEARAISAVCRQGAPDALMGVAYTTEELGGEVDENAAPAAAPVDEAAPTALPTARKRATKGAQGTRRRSQAQEVESETIEGEVVPEEPEATGEPETPAEPAPASEVEPEPVPEPVAPEPEPPTEAEEPPYDPEEDERAQRAAMAAEQEAQVAASDAGVMTWEERIAATDTDDDLRKLWDEITERREMTTDRRQAILVRKGEIKAADADRPMALGGEA